jgi:hypothetical protein
MKQFIGQTLLTSQSNSKLQGTIVNTKKIMIISVINKRNKESILVLVHNNDHHHIQSRSPLSNVQTQMKKK